MKQLVGFVGVLLASSAGAGQPGHLGMPGTAVTTLGAADLICETSARHKPAPKLEVTKNPGRICQLSGMELQLGRDTTKADDYKTPMCTVTAFK